MELLHYVIFLPLSHLIGQHRLQWDLSTIQRERESSRSRFVEIAVSYDPVLPCFEYYRIRPIDESLLGS
jgi:hypothetical protein